MTRTQLEHLIRAAGSIANDDTIVVIGSQSILAAFPNAPGELLMSMEADMYPLGNPGAALVVDGCIGEGSPFHESFGYYAQGVGPDTAKLADGWRERAVRVLNANTQGVTGLCLDPHDLVLSKFVAGREKDLEFNLVVIRAGMVNKERLLELADLLPVEDHLKVLVCARINHQFAPSTEKDAFRMG